MAQATDLSAAVARSDGHRKAIAAILENRGEKKKAMALISCRYAGKAGDFPCHLLWCCPPCRWFESRRDAEKAAVCAGWANVFDPRCRLDFFTIAAPVHEDPAWQKDVIWETKKRLWQVSTGAWSCVLGLRQWFDVDPALRPGWFRSHLHGVAYSSGALMDHYYSDAKPCRRSLHHRFLRMQARKMLCSVASEHDVHLNPYSMGSLSLTDVEPLHAHLGPLGDPDRPIELPETDALVADANRVGTYSRTPNKSHKTPLTPKQCVDLQLINFGRTTPPSGIFRGIPDFEARLIGERADRWLSSSRAGAS